VSVLFCEGLGKLADSKICIVEENRLFTASTNITNLKKHSS
jgi:hypothetical protein